MINLPKGTKDILPKESYKWDIVKSVIEKLKLNYNLVEIATPMFEHTELFVRGVGNSTDIVNKEMYTFNDKGNRSLTLKPEGTAGVVRSFIENGMNNDVLPLKLCYLTPCFRYEKPQAGRLRQHTQFGCEIFGADTVEMDAEAIMLACNFYKSFNINPVVLINNLGCSECRKKYINILKDYYKDKIKDMCPDCQRRYETNPLRILDCKVEECKIINKNVPRISDHLCDSCNQRFEKLKQILDSLNINYKVDTLLVRGLDYYTNLIFEFIDEDKKLGQNALGGGGRYNNLVEELGGKPTGVVGFGIGIERLLLYLENKGIILEKKNRLKVYVASITENKKEVLKFVQLLRDNNISVEHDLSNRSLKAQFKFANKINAQYVITIGDEEINSNKFNVKNLDNSETKLIDKIEIINYLKGE